METKDNFQISTFNFQLIRVAIVDDHLAVAEGFEKLINESGVAGVIGKAYSASGCMELLAQRETDILLLDLSLPDCNGLDLFLKIKTLYPDLKVIMLTSCYDPSTVKRAIDCGVSGYIMKNASSTVIIEGINAVASGELFLCNDTKKLIQERDFKTILLSLRENELLSLIIAGKKNKEIAKTMNIGYETVKSYRKHLFLKLNVSNTTELMKIALNQNYC